MSNPVELLKNVVITAAAYAIGVFWAVFAIGKFLKAKYEGKIPDIPSKRRTKPAILTDPKWGQHGFLQLKNGIRIHYVADGSTDKPLMLFLHGFPDYWFSWRRQMQHFKKDYRVVAIDNRGYGESDKPRETKAYGLPNLVEDTKLVIEALGYKKCVLVGHDWGGIIAWSTATVYPEMIERLVILNVPHPGFLSKMPLRAALKQFLMSWYIFLFQLPYLPEYMQTVADLSRLEQAYTSPAKTPGGKPTPVLDREEVEALKYIFGQPDAMTYPLNYYRNLFGICPARRPHWYPLRMPVLLIFGTADIALSVEGAQVSKEFVGGYFELQLMEGVSHWVHHEASPRVNQFIENFLKKSV
ncbi:epoxide hydrolase 4-like [Paramacrobiotus metropolitanus]|uniref:epoxide hydrolase 4-like n=1 Tax=Paramacrobiotus metropolitanus TaxID=2943436 RepID=UPI0024459052|nr:epoxide hydrolase 4-like [Paramacrobiotus metropolitanus]